MATTFRAGLRGKFPDPELLQDQVLLLVGDRWSILEKVTGCWTATWKVWKESLLGLQGRMVRESSRTVEKRAGKKGGEDVPMDTAEKASMGAGQEDEGSYFGVPAGGEDNREEDVFMTPTEAKEAEERKRQERRRQAQIKQDRARAEILKQRMEREKEEEDRKRVEQEKE